MATGDEFYQPNPEGNTAYGYKDTQSVRGEWGGQREDHELVDPGEIDHYIEGDGYRIPMYKPGREPKYKRIAGGREQDVTRYREMGGALSANGVGPQIDQSQSDQTRGIALGALSRISDAAAGNAPSQAEMLSRGMLDRSLQSQQAAAAAARGGPTNAAAALQTAGKTAALQRQQGMNDLGAMRAQEMERARGQEFSAATGLRGQDLGVATEQAKLNAQQRGLDAQQRQYYEKLGFDVNAAQLEAGLRSRQADDASYNANRTQQFAEDRASTDDTWRAVSVGTGAGMGAVEAGMKSDARAKTGIMPVGSLASLGTSGSFRSDVQSKTAPGFGDAGVMPLYEEPGKQLHVDASGRGQLVSESKPDALTGASFSGPTPQYSKSAAAPSAATATAQRAQRASAPKESPEDLKKWAQAELAKTQAAQAGAPAVKDRAPDLEAWAKGEIASTKAQTEGAKGARPAVDPMADAMRAMKPSAYSYKPEHTPPEQKKGETNVGPMAQNMAKDPVARTAVTKTPDGMLAIDRDKALKLTMGSLAALQAQLDSVKKGKR